MKSAHHVLLGGMLAAAVMAVAPSARAHANHRHARFAQRHHYH